MSIASRAVLIAILSVSAVAKLARPAKAADELAALWGVPTLWGYSLGLGLAWLEAIAAISLFVPTSLAFVPALVLFGVFSIAVAVLLAAGREGMTCGCGGKTRLTKSLAASNLGLALIALGGTLLAGSALALSLVGFVVAFGPRLLKLVNGYRPVRFSLPIERL